jgi:hypothetical protein
MKIKVISSWSSATGLEEKIAMELSPTDKIIDVKYSVATCREKTIYSALIMIEEGTIV